MLQQVRVTASPSLRASVVRTSVRRSAFFQVHSRPDEETKFDSSWPFARYFIAQIAQCERQRSERHVSTADFTCQKTYFITIDAFNGQILTATNSSESPFILLYLLFVFGCGERGLSIHSVPMKYNRFHLQ